LNDTTCKRIRVLLVDDHDVVRQGLRRVLEIEPRIQVVGEAKNGKEAISHALNLIPDVIIMDLKMPDMDGITATRELKQKLPNVFVLILTMYADSYFEEAIEAGAAGYLLKDGDSKKISQAVCQLCEGESPISPALNRRLISEYYKIRHKGAYNLDMRQKKILHLMSLGVDTKEICQRLAISSSTAKRDIKNIYTILGVNCRAHAVAMALKDGLLDQQE
jgi:two-component system, NarL family, response regulator LiaR